MFDQFLSAFLLGLSRTRSRQEGPFEGRGRLRSCRELPVSDFGTSRHLGIRSRCLAGPVCLPLRPYGYGHRAATAAMSMTAAPCGAAASGLALSLAADKETAGRPGAHISVAWLSYYGWTAYETKRHHSHKMSVLAAAGPPGNHMMLFQHARASTRVAPVTLQLCVTH